MKKVLGLLFAILLVGQMAACTASSPTDASATDTPSATSSATESKEVQEPEGNSTYGVNEPAQITDVELIVTNVEKSSGTQYSKAKEGMEYVIVTVKYKNVGDKENVSYNPYDFKIKNSKGQITNQTFTMVNTDTALSSGELAPGGEIEGTIAFEQPKDDAGLVLQYTASILSSSPEIEFNLN